MLRCAVSSPSQVLVGYDELKQLGNVVKTFDKKNAFIVCDPNLKEIGTLEKVRSELAQQGVQSDVFDGGEPEPKVSTALKSYKMFIEHPHDLIIGLGGGSSMDVAKTISVMTGPSIDNIIGAERIKERRIPLILLPTTSGTGSEITKFSILTDDETGQKIAIMSSRIIPDVAIVDPALAISMPAKVTAATGMDALSHAVECYLSPRASIFTETLAIEAIRLIGENLPKAFSKPDDIEARFYMSYASMLGGLLLNSTDGGGPIHGIGYPLGVHFHLPHGLSNTLMFVSVMDFVSPANVEKFTRIYDALDNKKAKLGDNEKAARVGGLIKDLVERIGLPKTLKEVDVKKEDLDMLTESAFKQQRLLKNSKKDFMLADVKTIFEAAYEGDRLTEK